LDAFVAKLPVVYESGEELVKDMSVSRFREFAEEFEGSVETAEIESEDVVLDTVKEVSDIKWPGAVRIVVPRFDKKEVKEMLSFYEDTGVFTKGMQSCKVFLIIFNIDFYRVRRNMRRNH
jgi:hypothetical protein